MKIDKLTAAKHLQEHFQLTIAEAIALVTGPQHPAGLRDEFAMAALQGHLGLSPDKAALWAYAYADAMMGARNANR